LEYCNEELDGIDMLCAERFASWDLAQWCEERAVPFEPVYPTYSKQREAFSEFYQIMREGRFKAPPIPVEGSKKDDLFREEASIFDHDPFKKWYGSPEKYEKYGIQDDSMYSTAWCIYGGRTIGPDLFRIRKTMMSFGEFYTNTNLVGKYA
ncbi:hypothetical protein HQ584_07615, partial [Patescibacteria group bacterium]|nr:hypothetical protein [Patescibacteria group bacterium]